MARITRVAKELGISPATVSRALSRPEMVAKRTRNLILQKAKELGIDIVDNRGLIEGQELLGVVVADLNNSFSANILNSITNLADSEGYKILLGVTHENPMFERKIIQDFNNFKLKGLIAMPASDGKDLGIACDNIVSLDRPYEALQTKCALFDNYKAVKIAYDHLRSKGHQRIVYISGKSSIYTFKSRLHAAASFEGIECIELDSVSYNDLYTMAFEIANILLSRNASCPSAILTANNALTSGVVYALSLKNISMPRDIALVSIGDTEWCRFFPTPITSVKLPEEDLARVAFDLLKSADSHAVRSIEPMLLPRASS